jgi:triphosphatase
MALESELKLRISQAALAKLRRSGGLREYSVGRPVTRRLYNVYYDTPTQQLRKSGMALRLRRVGRDWLQTMKDSGTVQAGLHQRREWEARVAGPQLDFSASGEVKWDQLLPKPLRKRLQPAFVTDFSRTSRILKFHGAEIELCIDRGQISTQQRSEIVCELELELKSGHPTKLFELALAILAIVPCQLEAVSKAEKGYRLLSGYQARPLKATGPSFAAPEKLGNVLQMLIWSCLQHFQANLSGARGNPEGSGEDAEYLHQMRVALRRLRVVLRMAESACEDAQLAALEHNVASAGQALGRVREWDVFVEETIRPICARMAGHSGLKELLAASERQRAGCYRTLHETVQEADLQRLMLQLAIWMNGDYWAKQVWQAPAGLSTGDFASRRLRKQFKNFARLGRDFDSADAGELHALRIAAKKLRYSAEFFSCLYNKGKAKPYIAALSEVQDVLGQINDIAVAHRLLDVMDEDCSGTQQHEAVVLAKGWIAHSLARRVVSLRRSMGSLKRQDVFWKNN